MLDSGENDFISCLHLDMYSTEYQMQSLFLLLQTKGKAANLSKSVCTVVTNNM